MTDITKSQEMFFEKKFIENFSYLAKKELKSELYKSGIKKTSKSMKLREFFLNLERDAGLIELRYDQNFSTSRYNKNLEKINHIKDVKNI